MTPQECREAIAREYAQLKERKVNNPDVIIAARCREAASHNGIPAYWREYLPPGAEP